MSPVYYNTFTDSLPFDTAFLVSYVICQSMMNEIQPLIVLNFYFEPVKGLVCFWFSKLIKKIKLVISFVK